MYYLQHTPFKLKLRYALRLFIKNLTDTRNQAVRKYNSAMDLKKKYTLADKDILEIGAGDRGGRCIILGLDNRAVAIDLPDRNTRLDIYLKTVIRRLFFDPIYWYHLRKLAKGNLHKKKIVYGDACKTMFQNESFDFIISESVLEHIRKDRILDLAQENKRLLRSGGIADHNIAVWTHLDGGHTFGWKHDEPWAHIRNKHFISSVYLNRLKISDYDKAFSQCFGKENVVVITTENHIASQLLKPEIFCELSSLGYSRDDLTIGSMRLVAFKK